MTKRLDLRFMDECHRNSIQLLRGSQESILEDIVSNCHRMFSLDDLS